MSLTGFFCGSCDSAAGDPRKDFELELKVPNCFINFFSFAVSLGNEDRVSSPMAAFVFMVSVGDSGGSCLETVEQKFYDSCSRRAVVAVRLMFTSADCSQPGMALSRCAIFWISTPRSTGFSRRGGAGMCRCRRRRSCSLGCMCHLPALSVFP